MHGYRTKRLLTEAEAAAYLGRSRDWLRHGRCYGHLPGRTPTPLFLKVGRSILYDIQDLDDWIDSFARAEHLAALEANQ